MRNQLEKEVAEIAEKMREWTTSMEEQAAELQSRVQQLQRQLTKLDSTVEDCGECGSGDVQYCHISVRYYCNECGNWAPVNFGDRDDALRVWNDRARERHSS